jgi:tRNA (cmo5U34)-methyltransferase
MTALPNVNLWASPDHAVAYLRRADSIPHRAEVEAALLECLPLDAKRVLDLGSGAGRLLDLVKAARPRGEFVAVDFSSTMLEALRKRFGGDQSVTIVEHDLSGTLPELGDFDAAVSSFAIHHVVHQRKRELYHEVFDLLVPGGVFCNLEHVASPTANLHQQFLGKLELTRGEEDPSNKLLDLETQLRWLREIGFTDVDCHWKWRELALLAGVKPGR